MARVSGRRENVYRECWLEEEVKPQAANWHSLDDVAHTLDGCIAKMAKLDKSINTTYFRQLVM